MQYLMISPYLTTMYYNILIQNSRQMSLSYIIVLLQFTGRPYKRIGSSVLPSLYISTSIISVQSENIFFLTFSISKQQRFYFSFFIYVIMCILSQYVHYKCISDMISKSRPTLVYLIYYIHSTIEVKIQKEDKPQLPALFELTIYILRIDN